MVLPRPGCHQRRRALPRAHPKGQPRPAGERHPQEAHPVPLRVSELARAYPTPKKRRVEAPKHCLLHRLKRLWRFTANERVDALAVQLAFVPHVVARLYPFDELARGVDDGTLSRGSALRSVGAAILGGLLSIFALPRDAGAQTVPQILWAKVKADGTLVNGSGELRHSLYCMHYLLGGEAPFPTVCTRRSSSFCRRAFGVTCGHLLLQGG